MLFNNKTKKITIFTILLLLSITAFITSFLGWFWGDKITITGGIYYNGFKTLGYAGIIVSSISLFFAIVLFTTQLASPHFFESSTFTMYSLIILVILLLIPSLILGLWAFFDLNHIVVEVKG